MDPGTGQGGTEERQKKRSTRLRSVLYLILHRFSKKSGKEKET